MAQQERMQMLQEKLLKAQRFNNIELFQEAQNELANEMRELMRKQMIPMCVRSLVFLGMFGLLGLLYGQYDSIFPFPILFFGKGWAAVYILTSLGLSLIIALFKKLFKKGTTQQQFVDIAGIRSGMMNLSMNQMSPMNPANTINPRPIANNNFAEQPPNLDTSSDAPENVPEWKKRMNAENGTEERKDSQKQDNVPEWKRKLQSQ